MPISEAATRYAARPVMATSTDRTGTIAAMPRDVLYTHRGCRPCDDAQRLLEAHGLAPECVNVDSDPQVRDGFGGLVCQWSRSMAASATAVAQTRAVETNC